MRKIYKILLSAMAAVTVLATACGPSPLVETTEGEISYEPEEYGAIEEVRKEFFNEESGEMCYYYMIEKYFLKDSVPDAGVINEVLQAFYEEYEAVFLSDAEIYQEDTEYLEVPRNCLYTLEVTYAGEDYISILYDNQASMGSAQTYSLYDGVTIDRKSGELINIAMLMGKNEDTVLEEISAQMGLDEVATWDDMDYYLTDSEVVFFYRMPGFYENVTWERQESRGGKNES